MTDMLPVRLDLDSEPPQCPRDSAYLEADGTCFVCRWSSDTTAAPSEVNPVEAFWAARPVLTHIHTFARARLVAPWGVLGSTLARVIAATDPNVQLPATIGSYASLNLFVGLVAKSGTGKDASNKVAREAVEFGPEVDFPTLPLGSGEGLSHMFMKYGENGLEQHTTAALVTIGEIDTMTALVKRQSSTVGSQLRQAAMGEQLGFFYVDTAKRMLVPEHRYRMCLIAGIQPKRAGALLGEADGGTPQRFIWMPATDPDAPDEEPECPPPMLWVPPRWHELGGVHAGGMYRNVMSVCAEAVTVVKAAHRARLRGTDSAEALDGHALLTRLKVAAGLAILEGRGEITSEDWKLAGVVMRVSDETREMVQKELTKAQRQEDARQAEADAHRAVVTDERMDEARVRRAADAIKRKLGTEDDWLSGSKVRGTVSGVLRDYVEPALTALVRSGAVEVMPIEYRGQAGHQYRLARAA